MDVKFPEIYNLAMNSMPATSLQKRIRERRPTLL